MDSKAGKLNYKSVSENNIKSKDVINNLIVTYDGELVAIGFENGHIKVRRKNMLTHKL